MPDPILDAPSLPPSGGAARLLCRVCVHFRADAKYLIEWCDRHRPEWWTREGPCDDYQYRH